MKRKSNKSIIIGCLYVDDLIFISNNPDTFGAFKKSMVNEFKMSNISQIAHFLSRKVL